MNLEETSLLFRCKMGFADAHDRRTFRRTFQFTYALPRGHRDFKRDTGSIFTNKGFLLTPPPIREKNIPK